MGLSYMPLRTAELGDLIAAAQDDEHDDSPAMNEIIRRFDGKVRRIAAAVCMRLDDHDDVANAARLALVRAVRRHHADREGFANYAVVFMARAARRESVRLARPPETCFDGSVLEAAFASRLRCRTADGTIPQQGWGVGRIANIVTTLSRPQQQLLDERYVQELELTKIAELHGTSVSAVSQRLGTVHKHVIKMMQPSDQLALAA